MATTVEAVLGVTAAIGWRPILITNHMRALRLGGADVWPKSGQGGGKSSVHVDPKHMVSLILGLASESGPSALRTVQTLRNLRAHPTREVTPPIEALPEAGEFVRKIVSTPAPPDVLAWTLGERIEAMIAAAAEAMLQGDDDSLAAMRAEAWIFNVAPDLPAAWAFGQTPEGVATTDQYQPANGLLPALLEPPRAPVRRSFSFGFALIEVAAELVADTHRQRAKRAHPAPEKGPENKEPDPCRDRAPATDRSSRPSKQPARNNRMTTKNAPDPTAGERGAQPLRARRLDATAGQPSNLKRKGLTDARAHPPDPAAA